MEAAHEAGVIHRDLKPANIKVREDGTVKVLDFGLAKALDAPVGEPDQSPTLTAAATQMGVIMGTAAYMSPEQARGKPLDKRSDIWAFGAVLFEMLAGQKAFAGNDASQTLARVIERAPSWTLLPDEIPGSLFLTLRRCLHKDHGQRIRDIGDVNLAMAGAFETIATSSAQVAMSPPLRFWQRPIPAAVIAIAVAAVASLVVWTLSLSSSPSVVRFTIPLAAEDRLPPNSGQVLALSPDGQQLVYAAAHDESEQLYVRSLNQLGATPLRGTDGAKSVFWSPDGEWVGFWADGQLKKVAVAGGAPETLGDVRGLPGGASWGSDDTIVFSHRDGLQRMSASGGTRERLTSVRDENREGTHAWPQVLPGGEAVLFTILRGRRPPRIAVQSLSADRHRVLLEGTSARYVPTGHLAFVRQNTLWAVSFDVDRLEVTGSESPVLEDILVTAGFAAQFSFAQNGSLVYASGTSEVETSTLVWVDREGRTTPWSELHDGTFMSWPDLSPDGDSVAIVSDGDIWISEEQGTRTRLTFDQLSNFPVWTPDGTRVVFASRRSGARDIYVVQADGSGPPQLLRADTAVLTPHSWSPDGEVLAFERQDASWDVWVWPTGQDPVPFAATAADEEAPAFSPDGSWIAYVSDESGQSEVYVQAYPGPGRKAPVSTGGGTEPVWSPDGGQLFYRANDRLVAVALERGLTLNIAAPTVVFEGGFVPNIDPNPTYDVSPDGDRFVMLQPESDADPEIIVVLNWERELLERVPIP